MVTTPKCPHCQTTNFEITESAPLGAEYKIYLVHCIGCGAPFGAMEYLVAGVLLKKQEETLAQIQNSLAQLESQIRKIQHAVKA
jgi:hypothetical protein